MMNRVRQYCLDALQMVHKMRNLERKNNLGNCTICPAASRSRNCAGSPVLDFHTIIPFEHIATNYKYASEGPTHIIRVNIHTFDAQ